MRRLGGWRCVERYSGRGTIEYLNRSQPADYNVDVWEQFVGGVGGRYKLEGKVSIESGYDASCPAVMQLENRVTLRLRLFPDGQVVGHSKPEFADQSGQE